MISGTFKQVEVVQTMFKQVGIKGKVRVGKLNVGILCFKVSTKPDRKILRKSLITDFSALLDLIITRSK